MVPYKPLEVSMTEVYKTSITGRRMEGESLGRL